MQLLPRIHLIGSGNNGLRLTHPIDCNVYLLDGGSELALIDAGGGIEPERIAAQVSDSGLDIGLLSTLLLTHAHGDHAAGAHFWHHNYGVQTLCAEEAKLWVESGDVEKISLRHAVEAGIYPPDYSFPPCPVARELNEGNEIQVGDLKLTTLETPGHARGHLSFLLERDGHRALFCGDLIFAVGKISLLNTWDCSIQDYSTSIQKIYDLNIEQLFPGHGPPLLGDAHRDIERAHNKFQKMGIPAPLI